MSKIPELEAGGTPEAIPIARIATTVAAVHLRQHRTDREPHCAVDLQHPQETRALGTGGC